MPPIGIIDVAMAMEARGDMKYGDKGNMTKAEIDKTIEILIEDSRSPGISARSGATFDQSVNLMASGEVVIQSMWSPAVTAVRSRGIACYYAPLKEGYRGWGDALGTMAHLSGLQARLRHGIPQLVRLRLAGRLHRQAGLLLAQSGDGEEVLTPTSGTTGTTASRPPPTSRIRTAS